MACNQSGSFDAGFASRWGIVDYDWSNWKEGPTGWAGTIPNDCEEKLVTQAVSTKAANNTTKVFVCEGSLPSCCSSHTAAAADVATATIAAFIPASRQMVILPNTSRKTSLCFLPSAAASLARARRPEHGEGAALVQGREGQAG